MSSEETTGQEGDRSIEQLADQGGVPVRTVRFYIAEGLLPGPGARGRAAAYTEEHLVRLRLIRRLVEQRVPLADIRARLVGLSVSELRLLLSEDDQRLADLTQAAETASPRDYVSALLRSARAARAAVRSSSAPAAPAAPSAPSAPAAPSARTAAPWGAAGPPLWQSAAATWRRMLLAEGVELHVRDDAARDRRDLIADLARTAARHGGHNRDPAAAPPPPDSP